METFVRNSAEDERLKRLQAEMDAMKAQKAIHQAQRVAASSLTTTAEVEFGNSKGSS